MVFVVRTVGGRRLTGKRSSRVVAKETHPTGEAVDFFLAQHGMTRADLAQLMGGRSRVSDFFMGVRQLSTSQIMALRQRLGIPADLLLE